MVKKRAGGIGSQTVGNMKDSPGHVVQIARRRGLSLPEVLISTVLVGVMLVAAMKTVGAVFRTRQVNAQLGDGEALAHQLMTEILQATYEDPEETSVPIGDPSNPLGIESGESGTTRADFDDVDDYEAWNGEPPVDKGGTALAGYELFKRTVNVYRVDPDTLQSNPNMETGLKLIQVTTIEPSGRQIVLWTLRSRFGAVEQPPSVDTTFVTWLGGTLRSGGNPTAVFEATNLVNHAEDQ
jgi:MSHA pilin protein MshD